MNEKDQKKQGTPPLIPLNRGMNSTISLLGGISHCHSKERPLRRRISQYQSLSFSLKTFFYAEHTGMIFIGQLILKN